MVKPFQFSRLPEIYFRNGIISELVSLSRRFGSKVLIVTGKSSFLHTLQAERLINDLESNNIGYHFLSVAGEPSPDFIDNAVEIFREKEIFLVIGIGGGSVLDAGKAISAMMYRPEPVTDFLEGVGIMEHPGTKLPFIAVPTTSGTGSEATKNAVISRVGKDGFKKSLRHDNFVPDIALVDPELTMKCPEKITAASGMDCFTQLTESFLSDKSAEYTDALAIAGLKAVKESLIVSYIQGDNLIARSGMSFAAMTSGICLANAGLGVVHGFASSIGGMYEIPHGLLCGTLMAASNAMNVRELRRQGDNNQALRKYAILGRLFLGHTNKSDDYYIDGFIDYLRKISDDLHLSIAGEIHPDKKEIEIICSKTEMKNNPVKLSSENLQEILDSLFV